MPGLFGILTLNPMHSISDELATNVLRTMAGNLSHGGNCTVRMCVSRSHGIAIGRISLPSAPDWPWPNSTLESPADPRIFIHGVLFRSLSDVASRMQQKETFLEPEAFLQYLNGFYSLVMCNGESKTVVIAADRRASEPIFYMQQRDRVLFAPEVKALLAVFTDPIELNDKAVPMFFSCGHLLGDQTLISSVKRLPGGAYLKIEDGKLRQRSYWRFLPGSRSQNAREDSLKEEFKDLLKQSVTKNIGTPEKTAILLSGGVDSRGILAGVLAAMQGHEHDIHTVSWGLDERVTGSDPNIARIISEKFNLCHAFFSRSTAHYPDSFEEANYIVDGLSDIAAFHPYEFTLMKRIKESGYDRVLRGDTVFGRIGKLYTYSQAETALGLRPLGILPFYSQLIEPKVYSQWSAASDAVMADVRSSIQGMEPNDARDYLNFTHRLQGYLHTAGYYKQVYFDHRNVLLEDSILEFLARVPSQYRLGKGLFRKAMSELNPILYHVPFANRTGYENWGNELVTPTSLREYVQEQLNDTGSGVWEYFNRPALIKFYNSLSLTSPSLASQEEGNVECFKNWIRARTKEAFFTFLPHYATELRAKRSQAALLPHHVILRFLVFKNWHDQFVLKRRRSTCDSREV